MSRFGSTATFYYSPNQTLPSSGGTTLVLNRHQMPQYPFETSVVTDRVTYRAKTGKAWSYENYNLRRYTFKWSLLDETMRNSLKQMWDSKPVLAFRSGGQTFGTFRTTDEWTDEEVLHELYDVEMTIEETT